MKSNKQPKRQWKWGLFFLLGILLVILFVIPAIFSIHSYPQNPTEVSMTHIVVVTKAGTTTAEGGSSVAQQLAEIDRALKNAVKASIAYNVPDTMMLVETVTIELLLNPSASPQELAGQVVEGGQVETSSIDVTPRMRAELVSQGNGLEVKALEDDPEQLISGTETTKWTWFVTAREEGVQRLTLVIYRLVNVDGKDDWRKLETYKENIEVKVTFGQRVKMLDWKWIGGIVIGLLLVPAFWRWFDNRKKKEVEKSKKVKFE